MSEPTPPESSAAAAGSHRLEQLDSNDLLTELRARRLSRNRIIEELMDAGLTLDEATDAFDDDIPVSLKRVDGKVMRAGPMPPPEPLAGLGGWLLFPMLGLLLRPVLCVRQLVAFGDLLQTLDQLPSAPQGLRRVILVGAALLVSVIVLDVVTAWFFFREKRQAPRLMIALYVLDFAATCFLYFSVASLPNTAFWSPVLVQASGVSAGVWIAYFLLSVRVRNTFVR